MSAKHTPGPWGVRKGFSSGTYEVYPKRPGEKVSFPGAQWAAIAEVEGASKGESARANALLMAASPDMLEALEKLVSPAGPSKDDIAVARAVLAKAKGGAA